MKIDFRANYFNEDFSNPIDDSIKIYFMNNLKYIVDQLIVDLKIPNNCNIIIPDDFGKELYKFQADKGLKQGYTNSPMGTAFAKVLDYMENGTSHIVIFINKALIFCLYSDKDIENMDKEQEKMILELKDIAINLMHHELIHIHDNEITGDVYNEIELDYGIGIIKEMKQVAINVWKEYYACRVSASTYNWGKMEEESTNLLNQIKYVYKSTEEKIREYRVSGDLDVLVSEVSQYVPTLLNYSAYALGKFSNYKYEDIVVKYLKDLDEDLIYTFFYDTWKEMYKDLDQIFDIYPDLDSSSFDNLSHTVLKCWNALGMYPEDTDEGVYISILL